MSKYNGHELANTWVYGPVTSRRYGKTVGLNLLPKGKKLCNFDCVYCQLGWNDPHARIRLPDLPNATQILDDLRIFLNQHGSDFQYLVVSGNGESTLNPHFSEIVTTLIQNRAELFPKQKFILFSNGSTWHKPHIWNNLHHFDEVALKWDALPKATNQPVGHAKCRLSLKKLKTLPNLVLQCCFLGGPLGNADLPHLKSWFRSILTIHPRRLDLYTASRPPADSRVIPVTRRDLEAIQQCFKDSGYDSITLQI